MNRLEGSICYISGPMDRAPDRGRGWREFIIPELRKRGIGVLNPLNKPFADSHFSEDENFVIVRENLLSDKKYDELSELMKIHVCRPDLAMCDKADFLIVYLDVDI